MPLSGMQLSLLVISRIPVPALLPIPLGRSKVKEIAVADIFVPLVMLHIAISVTRLAQVSRRTGYI